MLTNNVDRISFGFQEVRKKVIDLKLQELHLGLSDMIWDYRVRKILLLLFIDIKWGANQIIRLHGQPCVRKLWLMENVSQLA